MPDLVGAAPRAQGEAQRVDDQRFAAPGFAGQKVEAGPKANPGLGHQRQVANFEFFEQLFHGDERPAPTELLTKPPVEALRRGEPHDLEVTRMGAAAQPVPGLDRAASATTVDAQLRGPANDGEGYVLAGREHDRPDGEREKVQRHQHQGAQRRVPNGPSAGKRICGGSGGGRPHHPVGIDDADGLASYVDLHPQHPRFSGAVDDRLVEPDRARDVLPVSGQGRLQHVALFDSVVALEESLQARLEVGRVELRQETQTPEVDTEEWNAARRGEARPGEEGTVALEGDDQRRVFEAVGDCALGTVAIRLPGLRFVRLDRLERARDHRFVCVRRAEDADLHLGRRCTKISWLPSAPVSSEGASARTSYPLPAHHSRSRRRAASTASGSRTTPPFPTSARPTWNCGLNRATTAASGGARRRAGRTFSNPMKETSTTMSETGSGNDSSSRALTRSMTTTRGSDRSPQGRRPPPAPIAAARGPAPRTCPARIKACARPRDPPSPLFATRASKRA